MSIVPIDPDDPRAHPDTPMTDDEIRRVISDPVAVEAMLLLPPARRPSWNVWVQTREALRRFREENP